MLTPERLRELLHYEPSTGVFTWRIRASNRIRVGDAAGCVSQSRYRDIAVDRVSYRASRLAWLYMTGLWPAHQVDHKDRDRSNDRWINLRAATTKQNSENRSKRRGGSSKYMGVYWSTERKRWVAAVCHNGNKHYLGHFKNEDDAAVARAALARQLFTHGTA